MADFFALFTVMFIGILTLMAWSIMYRENPYYRVAECLTIGVGAGYGLWQSLTRAWDVYFVPIATKGQYINILPIALGFMLVAQVYPRVRYVSRIPLAFISGIGSAVAMKGAMYATILVPIKAVATPPAANMAAQINHVIAAIGTITTIMFFFFTIKPGRVLGPINRTGRIMMMVAFGSVCGSSILSNATFIYDRAAWFVNTEYAWIPLVGAALVIAYDATRRKISSIRITQKA